MLFAGLLMLGSSLTLAAAPDFTAIKDVKKKKKTFFDYIYKSVLIENKAILKEREILQTKAKNSYRVKSICKKYSKKCNAIDAAKVESLLRRVDVIPPSLALAQAANESAWGTSRFAKKANNYFGQWCFKEGCGLVPSRRSDGSVHEVRKFRNAQASVKSYMMNLNTGRVYADLRTIRAKARAEKETVSGMDLAKGLLKYSERGEGYVKELRGMIAYNKLVDKYDKPFWQAIKK
jgi:Bax protein